MSSYTNDISAHTLGLLFFGSPWVLITTFPGGLVGGLFLCLEGGGGGGTLDLFFSLLHNPYSCLSGTVQAKALG